MTTIDATTNFAAIDAGIDAQAAMARANLRPRERRVLELRHGLEMTLGEIGREFGVSEARAQQIAAQALAKVRKRLA